MAQKPDGANILNPHLVLDSAFGSMEMVRQITDWGGLATISFPQGHESHLWKYLTTGYAVNHWRGLFNPENEFVAVSQTIKDSKGNINFKHIVSSAFDAESWEVDRAEHGSGDFADSGTEERGAEKIPKYTPEELNEKTVKELKDICQKFNIRRGPAPRNHSPACLSYLTLVFPPFSPYPLLSTFLSLIDRKRQACYD
jgi:hypothetical protein